MNAAAVSITIPTTAWEPVGAYLGDPKRRLLARLELNGVAMHAEAFQVERRSDGQHLVDEDADIALGKLVGDGGFPVMTHTIGRRKYVVLISPCGD
jgi:hypothetical protein